MKLRIFTVMLAATLVASVSGAFATPPPARSSAGVENPAPQRMSSAHWQQMLARMELMRTEMREFGRTEDPYRRARLLQEHMKNMSEQMHAMRAMGGQMMSNMMGGAMGKGSMMGGGMMHDWNARAARSVQGQQWMQDRMDMMQMMMEQMVAQMHSLEHFQRPSHGHHP